MAGRMKHGRACNEHGYSQVDLVKCKHIVASNCDVKFICDWDVWSDTLRFYTWRYDKSHSAAMTTYKGKNISMAQMLIPDVPEGKQRVHINKNPLDNRICNLAVCTKDEAYIITHSDYDPTGLANIIKFPSKKTYAVYARSGNDITIYCTTKSKYEATQLRDIYNLDLNTLDTDA